MKKLQILKSEICRKSINTKDFDLAVKEWDVLQHYRSEDHPQKCTCTHNPISEIFEIQNRHTGHRCLIGNECIKHFDKAGLFEVLKKLSAYRSAQSQRFDFQKSPPAPVVDFLEAMGKINVTQAQICHQARGKHRRSLQRFEKTTLAEVNEIIRDTTSIEFEGGVRCAA